MFNVSNQAICSAKVWTTIIHYVIAKTTDRGRSTQCYSSILSIIYADWPGELETFLAVKAVFNLFQTKP
jgi:hypothetical protein